MNNNKYLRKINKKNLDKKKKQAIIQKQVTNYNNTCITSLTGYDENDNVDITFVGESFIDVAYVIINMKIKL